MYSEDSILIKADLKKVFKVAEQIDKFGDFIPQYKEVDILKNTENSMVLKRTARIAGKKMCWTSEATIRKDDAIIFEQINGILKGMHTEWRFYPVAEGTKIAISHDFSLKIPVVGKLGEKIIYNLFIKNIAQTILLNMKEKLEKEN